MMSEQWMYRAFGQEFGPLSFAELQELAQSGTIVADSEVRSHGSRHWVQASEVKGLGVASAEASSFPRLSTGSDPAVSVLKTGDGWFYNIRGLELGPVTFDQLLELASSEQVAADDQIKLGVNGKWRRAGSVGRLVAVLPYQAAQVKLVSTTRRTPPNGISIPREDEKKEVSADRSVATTEVPAERPVAARRTTHAAEFPLQNPPPAMVPVSRPAADPEVEILARVRESLDSRNIPGFGRLELFSNGGVVVIRGSLSTEGERLLAIRAVEQTQGVIRADDMLTVAGTQASRPVAPCPYSVPTRHSPAVRKSRPNGPRGVANLLEGIQGEYRNHAIGVFVAAGLLGFWFYPRGPVRPVAVHPVKGRVVLDGQPLANAAIVLHRVGNSKLPANLHPRGKALEDGSFMLETFDPKDGAPDGDFVATVFLVEETEVDGERQTGPNVLPAVYSKPETSPLKFKITSSTRELAPLELTKG